MYLRVIAHVSNLANHNRVTMAVLREDDSLSNCRDFTRLDLVSRKKSIRAVICELNEDRKHECTYPMKRNKDWGPINESSKLERSRTLRCTLWVTLRVALWSFTTPDQPAPSAGGHRRRVKRREPRRTRKIQAKESASGLCMDFCVKGVCEQPISHSVMIYSDNLESFFDSQKCRNNDNYCIISNEA